MEFGFPVDLNRNLTLGVTEENHSSAKQYPDHDKFIQEELSFGAMLGPFNEKPIPRHTSPLTTREKSRSDTRTINDLSWPKGGSVNAGVVSNSI